MKLECLFSERCLYIKVGPPHDDNYNILPVTVNPNLSCGNGWVCEHRWRSIYNMVKFRNIAKNSPVTDWFDGGESAPHQIAFTRGNVAFIAINNDDQSFIKSVPVRKIKLI